MTQVKELRAVISFLSKSASDLSGVQDLNIPRPSRMKKPQPSPEAHRKYKLYVQDLFKDILADKYGAARAETTFQWFIDNRPTAIYTVGQAIEDEKAQMYLDLAEPLPSEDDYFKESYLAVWNRWMARPQQKPQTPPVSVGTLASVVAFL